MAGDIRLDHRQELRRKLGLSFSGPETDAALVAAAYGHRGPDCCAWLEGDFAFALCDRGRGRLLLARDRFGVRPLSHAKANGALRFATEPEAIADAPPRPLEEAGMANYLAGVHPTGESSAWEGVLRLPPAHRLLWDRGIARIDQYWSLAPENLPDDPEGAFRECFEAAVRNRLLACNRPAALLSCGLDSSAICAAGGRILSPLRTYSLVYGDTSELDESRWIDAVLAQGNFEPTRVLLPDHAPLAGMAGLMRRHGGPIGAPGLTKSIRLYRRVAVDGIDGLLIGHAGDEVVWHGPGRLTDLTGAGRWPEALALIPAWCRRTGDDPFRAVLALVARHGSTHKGRGLARSIGRRLDSEAGHAPPWRRFLRKEVLDRHGIEDRMGHRPTGGDDASGHRTALEAPLLSRAFELFDKVTADAGLEARHPFFDARLVTLCLGLPSSE